MSTATFPRSAASAAEPAPSPAGTTPRERLLGAIEAEQHAHWAWLQLPGEPPPSPAYWSSVAELCRVWSEEKIPAALAPIMPGVVSLGRELRNHILRHSTRWQDRDFTAAGGFGGGWRAREEMRRFYIAAVSEEKKPALESVADLIKAKVSDDQIAAMWKCDPADVKREREQPGSVRFVEPAKSSEEVRLAMIELAARQAELIVIVGVIELLRMNPGIERHELAARDPANRTLYHSLYPDRQEPITIVGAGR